MGVNGELVSLAARHQSLSQRSGLSDVCLLPWAPPGDVALDVSVPDLVLGQVELLCCPGEQDTGQNVCCPCGCAALPISHSSACKRTCTIDLPLVRAGSAQEPLWRLNELPFSFKECDQRI